jgi:hypothetical protein
VAANITVHSCGGSRGIDRVPFLASAWAEEPRKRKATHRLVTGQCLDWGYIRCCGCCRWRFRSYSESLFQTPECRPSKKEPKGFAPAYGTSLRLSVPSLRYPSGGIAYGLLRCTSSRCVRLRRTALRACPPDGHLRSACRRGKKSKAKADQKIAAFGSSYRGLRRKIGRLPACFRQRTKSTADNSCRSCRRLRSFDLALKR